jgi:rifampicin phosphotransferase
MAVEHNNVIIPLCDADAKRCGNKAYRLACLIKAGLPVASGFCLPASLYSAALPTSLPAEGLALVAVAEQIAPIGESFAQWQPDTKLRRVLLEALQPLGDRVVVRSSSAAEDRSGQSAAGLFHSSVDVPVETPGVEAFIEAVRRTWASLWHPTAWALLRSYGSWPGKETMAVLVQQQISCHYSGIAHSAANPEQLYLEFVEGRGDALANGSEDPQSLWLPRDQKGLRPDTVVFNKTQLEKLSALILAAEKCLDQPVQVEWAFDGRQFWLLQARPQPASARKRQLPRDAFSAKIASDEGTVWRWDAEHNPEPLSPAHAELIECIDEEYRNRHQGASLFRVVEGYLFEAQRRPADCEPAARGSISMPPISAPLSAEGDTAAVNRAVEDFIAFFFEYRAQSHLSLRRSFAALRDFVDENLSGIKDETLFDLCIADGHAAIRATRDLYALAHPNAAVLSAQNDRQRFLNEYGDLFLRWDIAAPTLTETAKELWRLADASSLNTTLAGHRAASQRYQDSRRRVRDACAVALRDELDEKVSAVREARRRGEDDDLEFSRALSRLRGAYIQLGQKLVDRAEIAEVDAVFFLKRSDLSDGAALNERVAVRKKDRNVQLRHRPFVQSQEGDFAPPTHDGAPLRGLGVGGVAEGEVVVLGGEDDLLSEDFKGKVLVCGTLIPSLAIILPQLAALVSDHGGALSHAASLAREFGIPAVVGTQVATQNLKSGQRVWVDGAAGLVIPLCASDA